MSTSLPILNYDFAIKQLGGNEVLLRKMLGKFLTEFENASAELSELITSNDLKSAKLRVHTVKGISGNLGLQALYQCSTDFDAELRVSECSPILLAKFTSLMLQTCAEIRHMQHSENSKPLATQADLSPEESKPELIKRLEKNEFIGEHKLINLISNLGISEAHAKNLIELIEQLEYQQAIKLIKQHT
jgi:HPt (histidine-containing phosphotransfer) domain-containing protein